MMSLSRRVATQQILTPAEGVIVAVAGAMCPAIIDIQVP